MKLLFNQGTPAPLRRYLPGHAVNTLWENGWSDLGNGELLDLADGEGYEVLVTTDESLPYEQSQAPRRVGIVVLLSTDWSLVRLFTEGIARAIELVRPSQAIEVPIPRPR